MYLKQLKLNNFKNYDSATVSFDSNVNCLVGNNGVGKTNLLDAIYYLSFCKSFFNPLDSQNVREGADFFAIHGTYQFDDTAIVAACTFQNGQKKMRWNGKSCRAFSEHVGRVPLVMVSPSDQLMIIGGSELRRKFIDGVIAQVDHDYLSHLLHYQKAVAQRNRVLRAFADGQLADADLLAVWDDQLVQHGKVLLERRRLFLTEFTPLFDKYYQFMSHQQEAPQLRYITQIENPDQLGQYLHSSRQRDMAAQHSTVGPHKDDLDIILGKLSLRRFGSQGQQKTVTLALKLAQFDYIYRSYEIKPILLLDDIFDKLDMERISQLLDLVGGDAFGQVFLTDTQPGRLEQIFARFPHIDYTLNHIPLPSA